MGDTRPIAALGVAALLAGLAVTSAAAADDEDATRRVSFRVESARKVSNDWIRATLAVTGEDADPAALAGRVNETMAWALKQARGAKDVVVRSGGYSTHPVYDKQRIRRWRASQQLSVEGRDFDAVTGLLGELQGRLQLQSLDFSVSPEKRAEIEDELIEEALGAFQKRADLVRKSLGASGFEIVNLGIDTPGTPGPRPMLRMAAAAEGGGVAPPAVEGGTSRVVVNVAATIELD